MRTRSIFVVVGCVFVGFVTSAGPGLVARAAEPERWVGQLAPSGDALLPDGGDAQRRIVQLEQRLKELETERRGAAAGGDEASGELGAVIARNDELTARNRILAAENEALAQSQLFERPVTATACQPPPNDADPKAQLRYWAERLRDGDTFRDGLTTEQNAAINVLLRRQRVLDPRNPWREQ
jgi:hypothetical protein